VEPVSITASKWISPVRVPRVTFWTTVIALTRETNGASPVHRERRTV